MVLSGIGFVKGQSALNMPSFHVQYNKLRRLNLRQQGAFRSSPT